MKRRTVEKFSTTVRIDGLTITQFWATTILMSLQKRKDIRPPYLAIICPYFVIDRFSNICTTRIGILPSGRFYSDIIQVYCSMARRDCTLAVCARPDCRHMLQNVWLSVARLFTAVLFAALKNRKGHTTALFRSRMSSLCD